MLINGIKIVLNRSAGQSPTLSVRTVGNNGASTYSVTIPASRAIDKKEVESAIRSARAHHEAHRQRMIAEDAALMGKYPTE